MRLPIVKSLHIEDFAGTSIEAADYFNENAIIGQYEDGRLYATQRPSIDIFEDASEASNPHTGKGRGVYFWDKASDRYIVRNNKIYKGSAGAAAIATIGTGTEKVYFVEMVNFLVILDPENNKGYYIANTSPWETVVQITDADFPGQASNTDPLIAGGAFLAGRLYVGGESGAIYGSGSNTPVTWDALNKISAEREADDGVYVDKHLDHIVLFGTRTIEFFYLPSPANPTGSTLSKRRDIFHNIGMLQGDAAWREGDDIYFVAVHPSGPLDTMKMTQFIPQSVSTPEVESYITNARLVEDSNITCCGFTTGKRTFFIMTFYRPGTETIVPSITLVFDGVSWGIWDTKLTGLTKFPLIGWTIRSGSTARSGEGIMANGDLITSNDNFIPSDSLLGSDYILDAYVADGYYASTGVGGVDITMTVRTGTFDGDNSHWKFAHVLELVGDETESIVDALIKWADGNSVNFNAGKNLNLYRKQKLTRMGRFKRRNHEVVISIPEQYRIEALDLEFTEGGH